MKIDYNFRTPEGCRCCYKGPSLAAHASLMLETKGQEGCYSWRSSPPLANTLWDCVSSVLLTKSTSHYYNETSEHVIHRHKQASWCLEVFCMHTYAFSNQPSPENAQPLLQW
eukprot:scaffold437855_cov19-Prasinocladus_malaysianus.AAC.1